MIIHDQHSAKSSSPFASATNTPANNDTSNEPVEQPVYVMVSTLPELKGGNRALRKTIDYPEEAIQNSVEGIVSLQFRIDGEGNTSNFVVTEGIGYGCDDAVIRAICESEFTPGGGPGGSTVNFLWEVTAEFRL